MSDHMNKGRPTEAIPLAAAVAAAAPLFATGHPVAGYIALAFGLLPALITTINEALRGRD